MPEVANGPSRSCSVTDLTGPWRSRAATGGSLAKAQTAAPRMPHQSNITVERPADGRRIKVEAVYPLAYRDTSAQGWVFATVGWAFTDVKAAD